ncbi:toprim domain-containing protein [Croceicoccus sp. YJ47]|uniref:DUF7146 domain-containing protein n=1 Tax=Croceicoccus sp. YJ47 TaxID=2798724 RepID=UPI00192098CA|nr:toprim domain-containing protein [Croceicoccus sp. YJ47]QQN75029.1 toprim domain-containing protein [Croceicoccus sp. YJ47]
MTDTGELSARDIAQMLNAQAEALAWSLFPAGHKAGGFFCIGSIDGEKGQSLKIRLKGSRQGTWADYSKARGEPGAQGDMLKLLQATIADGDLAAAVREAKKFLNLESMDPRALERQRKRAQLSAERAALREASDKEKTRINARRLWWAASPLTPSSPPVLYLQGRGIDFAHLGKLPGAIRFHRGVWQPELRREVPAMVTAFTDLSGQHAGTHCTFLQREADGRWVKLRGVATVKKIVGRTYWGAHIPLWKGVQRGKLADIRPGTPVDVAEGIEDGLSFAMADPAARVIAAGTLGNIAALRLPPQAGTMNILAQRDPDGSMAAASLEKAIADQQRIARSDGSGRQVACRWTPEGIKDWNDWLQQLRRDDADADADAQGEPDGEQDR